MDLKIAGKRALITGGGRGIGRAAAEELAREGVKVAIVTRSEEGLKGALDAIGGELAGHVGIAMDLEVEGAPDDAKRALQDHNFWPVDIVVHNLGSTLNITDPMCSVYDWRKVWRVNFEVAIELNLLLIPEMKERGWGRIIHVSSVSGTENQGPVTYCTVKAALTAYARSQGRVLAKDGIVLTSVLPGAVFTDGGYWDIASSERPQHVERYLKERMAIGRFGRVEEISSVIAFLCSEQASFCVGSTFLADGGQGRSFFMTGE